MTVVVCIVVPLVPVMVRAEVEVGVAKPLPLPQPVVEAARPQSRSSASKRGIYRLRLRSTPQTSKQARESSILRLWLPWSGPELLTADNAGIVTVKVVVGCVIPGTNVAGEKLAVTPEGSPVTDRLTVPA